MHNFLGKTAIAIIISVSFLAFLGNFSQTARKKEAPPIRQPQAFQVITGIINKGETLFDIFKRHQLNITELYKIREASADIHKLREIYPGRQYKIICDNNEQIRSFLYWIDDDCYLDVNRTDQGYCAEKIPIAYEKKHFISKAQLRGTLSLPWEMALKICFLPCNSPIFSPGTSILLRI